MGIFLNYEGVKGESSDPAHKDWIDVKAWQWDGERNINSETSTQGDRESANTVIRNLHLSKYMDSASPKLFIEFCCGTGKDVILRLTKTGTGSGADIYMEYTLKNALISGYKVRGSEHDTHRPIEDISISFVDIEVKYTPYDDNGIAMAPIAVGFDTATNTKR